MNPIDAPSNSQQPSADSETIPVHERAILWMFLVGFVVFAVIIVSDLIAGFFR